MAALRYLFIDMNSYFASVEQLDNPALRGKPVAVAPVMAETSCCIAASYEAKRQGVKTGTGVRDARSICPGIIIVQANPKRYVEVHHQIIAAVEKVLHVDKVMSIDEMTCRLLGAERDTIKARNLALEVKAAIRREFGESLRCSVGLGPNILIAKVAADMQKPDGLTMIESHELPGKLETLDLEDLPGIGPRMRRRLNKQGILSIRQLCQLTTRELSQLWGSKVLGGRWFFSLRGEEVAEVPTRQSSVGHSHVLPPQLRCDPDAWAVLQRMLYKAAMRLRNDQLKAQSISVHLSYLGQEGWGLRRRIDPTADTTTLLRVLHQLFWKKPVGKILKVGVVLGDAVDARQLPEHLFPEDRNLLALSNAMDQVNQRFGIKGAYFGGLHQVLQRAPMRIAFNRIPDVKMEGLSEVDNRPPPSASPSPKMGKSWGSPPGSPTRQK
ncbi:MAG: DNA polymerase [Gemmatales bacterium]